MVYVKWVIRNHLIKSVLNDMTEKFMIEMVKHVISVIRKYMSKSLLNDITEKFMIEMVKHVISVIKKYMTWMKSSGSNQIKLMFDIKNEFKIRNLLFLMIILIFKKLWICTLWNLNRFFWFLHHSHLSKGLSPFWIWTFWTVKFKIFTLFQSLLWVSLI